MKRRLSVLSQIVLVALVGGAFTLSSCGAASTGESSGASLSSEEKVLRRIAITSEPTKLLYEEGDLFDSTGMVVTGYYSDGTSSPITDYTYDKTSSLTTDDSKVTITAHGKIAYVDIRVRMKLEEMLSIATAENEVYSLEAESLDLTHTENSNDQSINSSIERPTNDNTSGGLSVGGLGIAGNTVGFVINSSVDANMTLVLRAAAVSAEQSIDSVINLEYNDATIETGGSKLPWDDEAKDYWNWQNVFYRGLTLRKGKNSVRLTMRMNAAPNLDSFYFVVNPTGNEEIGPKVVTKSFNDNPDYDVYATVENDEKTALTVEAEALSYSGCVSSNNPSGEPNTETPDSSKNTSGGSCKSSLGVKYNQFGFDVQSSAAIPFAFGIRVSNGNPCEQIIDSLIEIRVNGDLIKTEGTLSWSDGNWFDWKDFYVNGQTLIEGKNVFDVRVIADGAPNIDCFYLKINQSVDPDGEDDVETTYEKKHSVSAHIISVDSAAYTIEAESLDYSRCVSSNNPDESPNTECPSTETSGGYCKSSLGAAGNTFGYTVQSDYDVENVTLGFRVSSGIPDIQVIDDIMTITWNGAPLKTHFTVKSPDQAGGWHQWETFYVAGISLAKGYNNMDIEVLTGCPNLDCFFVYVNPTSEMVPTYAVEKAIASLDKSSYTIEAEDLDYSRCKNSNNPEIQPNVESPDSSRNTSGGHSIGGLGVEGNAFGYTVSSEVVAPIALGFRMASGNSLAQNIDDVLSIQWNGQTVRTGHTVKSTEEAGGWHVWEDFLIAGFTLRKGFNDLAITVKSSAPNIDCFSILVSPSDTEAPTHGVFETINNDTSNTYIVEAESLDYSRCVSSNNPDESPNTECPSTETSGGYCKSSLGAAGNTFGFSVESTVETTLTIDLRVSSGTGQTQVLDDILAIRWNDSLLATGHTVKSTEEAGGWHVWEDADVTGLTLKKGYNNFDVSVLSGCPNIDCFRLIVNPSK